MLHAKINKNIIIFFSVTTNFFCENWNKKQPVTDRLLPPFNYFDFFLIVEVIYWAIKLSKILFEMIKNYGKSWNQKSQTKTEDIYYSQNGQNQIRFPNSLNDL